MFDKKVAIAEKALQGVGSQLKVSKIQAETLNQILSALLRIEKILKEKKK